MTYETWGEIRENLIGQVGKNNYVNWIEPLEFSELSDGVARFHVPTQFMGSWVKQNFGDQIRVEAQAANNISTPFLLLRCRVL